MPDDELRGFRLTPAAQDDLETIWDYTVSQWSIDQAETYLRGLQKTLDLLVYQPYLGRERQEIFPPVRLHAYRLHLIIYRIESGDLEVIRIPHNRRNWSALLDGQPK